MKFSVLTRLPITRKSLFVFVGSLLGALYSSYAVDYTWLGGVSNDWTNAANWQGGTLPATQDGRVTGSGNTIIIQNGTFLPTVNVPDFNHHGIGAGTPRIQIEDGADFTANFAAFGYNGPVGAGTIATVGSGASLTWTTSGSGQMSLMRDPNGTQTFNINGGTLNFNITRLDFGWNDDRFSVFNVDGGVFNFSGTSMFGSVNAGGDIANATGNIVSEINLLNGSVFNAASTPFSNNYFYSGGEANTVFDLGSGSALTAKFGGIINNMTQFEDQRGNLFVSSTLGNANLVYTDNGNGTFTVTAVPEPGTFALFAGMAALAGMTVRRRRS